MDEEPKARGGWVVGVVFALLLYVLSIGPAAVITEKTARGQSAIQVIYAPLIWLHHNTALRRPLEAYVELWGARP